MSPSAVPPPSSSSSTYISISPHRASLLALGPKPISGDNNNESNPNTSVSAASSTFSNLVSHDGQESQSGSQQVLMPLMPSQLEASSVTSHRVLFCGPVCGDFARLHSYLSQACVSAGRPFDFAILVGDFFGSVEWRPGKVTDQYLLGIQRFNLPLFVCDATHGHERLEFPASAITVLPNGRVSDIVGYRVATLALGGPTHAMNAINEVDIVLTTEGFAYTSQLEEEDFHDWGVFKSVSNISDQFAKFLDVTRPRYWIPAQHKALFRCLPIPPQKPGVPLGCKLLSLSSMQEASLASCSLSRDIRFLHGVRVFQRIRQVPVVADAIETSPLSSVSQDVTPHPLRQSDNLQTWDPNRNIAYHDLRGSGTSDGDHPPAPSGVSSLLFGGLGAGITNKRHRAGDQIITPDKSTGSSTSNLADSTNHKAYDEVESGMSVKRSRIDFSVNHNSGTLVPPIQDKPTAEGSFPLLVPPWRSGLSNSSPGLLPRTVMTSEVCLPKGEQQFSTPVGPTRSLLMLPREGLAVAEMARPSVLPEKETGFSPITNASFSDGNGGARREDQGASVPAENVSNIGTNVSSSRRRRERSSHTSCERNGPNDDLSPNFTVFIPNAPFSLSKNRIVEVLSRFGKVEDVRCPRPLPRAQSARIWVDFLTAASAKAAVEESDKRGGIYIDLRRKVNVLLSTDQRGRREHHRHSYHAPVADHHGRGGGGPHHFGSNGGGGGGSRRERRVAPQLRRGSNESRRDTSSPPAATAYSGPFDYEKQQELSRSSATSSPRSGAICINKAGEDIVSPSPPVICENNSSSLLSSRFKQRLQTVVDKRPHQDCWFCLANPNTERDLVVSVGYEVYLSAAKGCLVEGHLLLLPLSHEPNIAGCPLSVVAEMDLYINVIDQFYRGKGMEVVIFERYIPMRVTRAMHTQVHIVPIPRASVKSCLFALSNVASMGDYVDIKVEKVPRGGGLTSLSALYGDRSESSQRSPNITLTNETPYVFLDLPNPTALPSGSDSERNPVDRIRRLLTTSNNGKRLEFDFVRKTLAMALGVSERADWRQCVSGEPERETATRVRLEFAESEKQLLSLLQRQS